MSAAHVVAMGVASVSACVAVALGALAWFERRARLGRREAKLEGLGGIRRGRAWDGDIGERTMRYLAQLTRSLYTGATVALTPSVRAGTAGETRAGRRYREVSVSAGCRRDVSVAAYCEARNRLTGVGVLVGALVGAVFSWELAVLLAVLLGVLGRSVPRRTVDAARRERAAEAERRLSEMLEVVALGLRSGLSFDLSFALYGGHFDNGLAQSCTKAYRRWSLGLSTREEALREFAESYDSDQLGRVVDSIVRSLKLGTPLTGILEEAAEQSRAAYRASLEERVAKAPVKMMLPTGTLILPAMLLLVMGPVLLELAGGF